MAHVVVNALLNNLVLVVCSDKKKNYLRKCNMNAHRLPHV